MLDRQAAVIDAEAAFVDAQRAYEKLTGLTVRPASFAEQLTARSDYDETHPLLALAEAELARARAERTFTARETRGKTLLTIGPRRQRDPYTNYFDDSVGVSVSVPFGGRAQAAPEMAAAGRRVAEALAQQTAVRRDVETAMHEAAHTLETTENALELAERRADLSEQRWEMGQKAFEAGEISLTDLLRREEAARAARRETARLRIKYGRTIAEVNQAVGELP